MNENVARHEIASLFRGQFLSYLVGFYVFAFFMELHLRIPALQAIRFQFTFGAVVGACCLYKMLSAPGGRSAGLHAVTKAAIFLIIICGIYTIFSMDRDSSFRIFSDRMVKFSLVSFFIYAAVDKVEDLRVIVAFMLLAWLKMGQEGFWGWYTGSLVWQNQGIPRLHGPIGKYGHPNSFSGFAVGCLPYAIYLLKATKSKLLQMGLVTIVLFSLIIIVTTGSRTGYVALVLGALYVFLQLKKQKFKLIVLASLTIFLTINLVPEEYKGRFESIFTGEEAAGSSSETRLQIIEDAIDVYARYPMGVGVHAFPKVRGDMFGRFQDTHNLYLQVLTNIGPFGLITFFVFVYMLLRQGRTNCIEILSRPSSADNKFLLAIAKATSVFILLRLVLGLFGMDLYEIYWWLALGIVLAIAKILSNESPSVDQIKPA